MRWRRKPLLILSIWSRPSCRGAGATSGITRPERCARSSTAKVAHGSAQIIQQSGSAILPICPAVDERVGRGLATPPSCWTAISRSWREISYSRTPPRGDRGFESCPLRQPVCLTGASHGLHTLRRGFRGSMSLDETRERDVLATSRLVSAYFL